MLRIEICIKKHPLHHCRDVTWPSWHLNQWSLNCLFNSWFRLTSTKTSKLHITGVFEGQCLVHCPHKGPVMQKVFPCHNFIIYIYIYIPYLISPINHTSVMQWFPVLLMMYTVECLYTSLFITHWSSSMNCRNWPQFGASSHSWPCHYVHMWPI